MAKRPERNQKTQKASYAIPGSLDLNPFDTRNPARFQKKPEPLQAQTEAQGQYISAFMSSDIIFGIGPAGTGKAQPMDSLILTPDGWCEMSTIKVGSIVVGSDGLSKAVTGVFPKGERQVFRVTTADGRNVECCAEHLWEISFNEWKNPRVVNTLELQRLSQLKSKAGRIGIRLVEPVEGKHCEFIVQPYTMGALLGDGCMSSPDFVGISSADDEVVDKIESELPDNLQVKHRSGYDFTINKFTNFGNLVNPVIREIKRLGLLGKTSTDKFIPVEYMAASASQRWELLRGLMDTDGTVGKQGGVQFSTSSKQLSSDFVDLVRSLGGICSVSTRLPTYTYKGKKKTGQLSYTHHVRFKNQTLAFALPRKLARLGAVNQYSDCLMLRVVSVVPSRVTETQCIAVDSPDHLYVTNDYVLTHNTYCAAAYAAQQLMDKRIDKIIVTRPNIEVGAGMGFLPGELEEKYAPFLAPFEAIMVERMGRGPYEYALKADKISPRPLGFMRGATFDNAIVILDEAQNTTPAEMKMFLTRIGKNCTVIVDGDVDQCDINGPSGLTDALHRLHSVEGVRIVEFTEDDIVRSGIVRRVLCAYRRNLN